MFVLIYQYPDVEVPAIPDAVGHSVEVLKKYAVEKMNGGEELNWVDGGGNNQTQSIAYVEVGDDELDENGESECFYIIEEVELVI